MFARAIPRCRVTVAQHEVSALFLMLACGKLIRGNWLKKFENEFSKYIGINYAIGVSSGRLGLQLILKSLSLDPEDEIIIPAYTFPAVPETVVKLGLKPIFVDINERDYNINVNLIEKKITQKTKAVIATHILGAPCDLEGILGIAKKYNLFVIEDCAQAIGAEYNGKKVGSFGDCAFFSFETVKPFHTFGGGMVTTDNRELYEKMKSIIERLPSPSPIKITRKISFTLLESILTNPYIFSITMYPLLCILTFFNIDIKRLAKKAKKKFKLSETSYTNFQAYIGYKKLPSLESLLKKRIENAEFIISKMHINAKHQMPSPRVKAIYYYLAVDNSNSVISSGEFLKQGLDINYNIMPNCAGSLGKQAYPVAEMAANRLIVIPVYPQLKNKDLTRIIRVIEDVCRYLKR